MPLIETKGAASAQGFGEFATSSEKLYIESCFSTWLYTGNGSTQTITNGIDLAGKGGMVWVKCRSSAYDNILGDSERLGTSGGTRRLISNSTAAQSSTSITTFFLNSDGFATNGGDQDYNGSGETYASWTFRKQPKFFDVVTWTGNSSNRTISHNLGSVPGCIIVKRTDTTGAWQVYHRSIANTEYMVLNTTAAKATGTTRWNSTTPTSTEFSLGTDATVNASGGTYVAYLFAHNAGGFGLSGTDNVISCGSYTGTGASPGPRINLGWEPQFILYKAASTTGDWGIHDSMRGLGVGTSSTSGSGNRLEPNTSDAETGASNFANIDATGFTITSTVSDINGSGQTYIYIAIRRGPMKVPTSGTSVFSPALGSGSGAPRFVSGFPTDTLVKTYRYGYLGSLFGNRLTGDKYMSSASTAAEASDSAFFKFDYQNGTSISGDSNDISWNFRRAPGFMDVVCWTGDAATNRSINHNLQTAPQLLILKVRSAAGGWAVYTEATSSAGFLLLNSTAAYQTGTYWGTSGGVAPTASQFTVNGSGNVSTYTYVAYLFATLAGVSKVGSYTGSGTTKQIDCGFTAGARFVMIKRTDSTGDWYVWDSARGIVAGNDSYLVLNSNAAEVTTTDWVDTYSAGFELSSAAGNNVNINGASYIFLSVA